MSLRLCIAVGLLLLGSVNSVAAEAVTEDDVKLALIYKIARFVSWPEPDAVADFRLCIAGEQAYRIATQRLRGRQIRERDIRVTLLAGRTVEDGALRCDIVYVTEEEAQRSDALVERFDREPVLMISDIPRFAETGGMVGLSLNENRIGMTINVAAYERAGLSISSQLLELARVIGIEQRAGK